MVLITLDVPKIRRLECRYSSLVDEFSRNKAQWSWLLWMFQKSGDYNVVIRFDEFFFGRLKSLQFASRLLGIIGFLRAPLIWESATRPPNRGRRRRRYSIDDPTTVALETPEILRPRLFLRPQTQPRLLLRPQTQTTVALETPEGFQPRLAQKRWSAVL